MQEGTTAAQADVGVGRYEYRRVVLLRDSGVTFKTLTLCLRAKSDPLLIKFVDVFTHLLNFGTYTVYLHSAWPKVCGRLKFPNMWALKNSQISKTVGIYFCCNSLYSSEKTSWNLAAVICSTDAALTQIQTDDRWHTGYFCSMGVGWNGEHLPQVLSWLHAGRFFQTKQAISLRIWLCAWELWHVVTGKAANINCWQNENHSMF